MREEGSVDQQARIYKALLPPRSRNRKDIRFTKETTRR
jgi:hypothetical protein